MKRPGRKVGIVVLAVLAALTVLIIDGSQKNSPFEPVRTLVGNVVGPIEVGAETVWHPISKMGDYFSSNKSLRKQVAKLESENDRLRGALALQPEQLRELDDLAKLTGTAQKTGYQLVAARVVAVGPAQTFGRTVTIDAGTNSGVRADLTVVNDAGLIGRVIRATETTATVLLITDPNSVVGGRMASVLTIGNIKGQTALSANGGLELSVTGSSTPPAVGEAVMTWGSPNGVPYVAGIPIGTVESISSSPRELTVRAVIKPFADFGALDLVGVVVPAGTKSDRPLVAP